MSQTEPAAQANIMAALAMLSAFSSVGVQSFDVTLTDIQGEKVAFRTNRHIEDLRRSIGRELAAVIGDRQNYIIRPRSNSAKLIQLDDLDSAKAGRVAAYTFMVIETSPGNFQAWVAVKEAPEDFARRLRKGAGADPSASGATRISGSLNFKTKYAPTFPQIEITQSQAGRITTAAELASAGLVAPAEEPPPRVSPRVSQPSRGRTRKWPNYAMCVKNAPPVHQGERPDVSRADFTWCMMAIDWGHSQAETASRLMEESSKAQENGEAYAVKTATSAAAAVARRSPTVKPPRMG